MLACDSLCGDMVNPITSQNVRSNMGVEIFFLPDHVLVIC